MKKIIVTGASGFIGRHVIDILKKENFEIHALSRHGAIAENESVMWHSVDLFNQRDVEKCMQEVQPSHLIHLAWDATPGQYVTSLSNYQWIEATLCLFRNFVSNGGIRAVVAGTCAEYQWDQGILKEDDETNSYDTPYSACKNYTRSLLFHLAQQTGLSLGWARLFFLYGPMEPESRLVPSIIRSLLKDETAKCTEGTQKRDFLYVEDAAEAINILLKSNEEGIYNIASGQAIRVIDLVNHIALQFGKSHLILPGAVKEGNVQAPLVQGDISKIQSLGWQPKVDLYSGMNKTIQWWKNTSERL